MSDQEAYGATAKQMYAEEMYRLTGHRYPTPGTSLLWIGVWESFKRQLNISLPENHDIPVQRES